MAKPTFYTFTITVADAEQGTADNVRAEIIDALKESADLMVIEADYGQQMVLKTLLP